MEYVAIRTAEGLNNEYWVMGQRNTDYNWAILGKFAVKADAEKAANFTAKELSIQYKCYIPCYNCSGYGKGYLKGKIYNN